MVNNKIIERIDSVIKTVWSKDLKMDYDKKFLLKEDTLKNAFYFHLRTRLGESFLNENNLRIFTEYYIDGERIDLVIVEIDPVRAEEYYLGDCVNSILAVVEMKYLNPYASASIFYKDVQKILSFIHTWDNNTKHYLAFIQEKYFKTEDIENWFENEQAANAKGKVTELYAYWNVDSDETVWSIADH